MTSKGFTLIETILYIALLSLITSGALLATYQLLEGNQKNLIELTIQSEADFLLRKIEWILSGSQSVVLPREGESGPELVVRGEAGPVSFTLSGADLVMSRDGGQAVPLNSQNVSVTDLVFEHLEASDGKPAGIRTVFKVGGRVFETLKYLR